MKFSSDTIRRTLAAAIFVLVALGMGGCSSMPSMGPLGSFATSAAASVGLKATEVKAPETAAVKEACEGNLLKKTMSFFGASAECWAAKDDAQSNEKHWEIVREAQRKAGETVTPTPAPVAPAASAPKKK